MISLIHPSRGRPKKSFDTVKSWINQSGTEVELIVGLDADDPCIEEYKETYFLFHCVFSDEPNVVNATNEAAKYSSGDILIYLTDDFLCFPDWAKVIEERIGDTSKPVMLKVDDCLQQFRVGVLTIPIMTRALYAMLGYFFHPAYKSMHVDVDLYETCKRLNVIKYCPDLKFPHHHVSNGKAEMDETYRRSTAHWNQGLKVIAERRRLGFPL